MKKKLFHEILNDCGKATLLVIKREETNLNVLELAKLRYHLFYCSVCRNFVDQSRLINEAMRRLKLAIERRPPFVLSDKMKSAIQEQINNRGEKP